MIITFGGKDKMDIEEEQPEEPIILTIKIDPIKDEILYNRLCEIPHDKRIEHVLSWLRIGEITSNLIVAQTSETAIASYFSPIILEMKKLEDTIDAMKGDFSKSQALGEIGQEILKGQFQNYFSHQGDSFEIVADSPHQADIHAAIQVPRKDGGFDSLPILIEAKLYNAAVPGDEVEKFWDDLNREAHFKAGIFVSLGSDIAGKKGPINIDVSNGRLALFIANHGTDQMLHIVAWALLREMLRVQIQQNIETKAFKKFDIERFSGIIKQRMEEIEQQLEKVEDIEKAAQDVIPAVSKLVGKIHNSAGSLRHGIDSSLAALNREFNRELIELTSGEKPELPEWQRDKWHSLTESADDKHTAILEVIRVLLSNHKDFFTLKQGDNPTEIIGCIKDGETCFKITWISTKVRMYFAPIDGVDFNEFTCDNVKVEGNGWLMIEGKANIRDLGGFDFELVGKLLCNHHGEPEDDSSSD